MQSATKIHKLNFFHFIMLDQSRGALGWKSLSCLLFAVYQCPTAMWNGKSSICGHLYIFIKFHQIKSKLFPRVRSPGHAWQLGGKGHSTRPPPPLEPYRDAMTQHFTFPKQFLNLLLSQFCSMQECIILSD